MEKINSKITRQKLYQRIYEPYETIVIEEVAEENNSDYYDEAAKFLVAIYLIQKGDCLDEKR